MTGAEVAIWISVIEILALNRLTLQRYGCGLGQGTADVKSISLLTAEAQIGDSFRYVDLAEQIAVRSVAPHAVLVRIAPTHGAPNPPFGVTAYPWGAPGQGLVLQTRDRSVPGMRPARSRPQLLLDSS